MAAQTENEKRAYGPAGLGTLSATLITVPANHRYIIKEIRIVNESTTLKLTPKLYLNSAGAGKQIIPALPINTNGMYLDQCWTPIEASETVVGVADGLGLTITISVVDIGGL